MPDLRANTAVDVLIGPFVDSTNGNDDETGLTITQADVRLSKNGQNMAQKNDANTCVHDEISYYNCPLDITDLNTEGTLDLMVHKTGALHFHRSYNVLSEAAWDSLYAAKDVGFMDVNIKTVGRADAQETEANNLESACAAYGANRGLAGNALPDAACDAANGLPKSDTGGLDLDAILADTNELQGDWANAGRLDAILDIIAADTITDIPALIATLQADLDIITGAAGVVIADGAITAAKLGADCITAAKVAADVHTENGAAVLDATEAITGQAHSLEYLITWLFRYAFNDKNITDATGVMALRNEANNADIASRTITDDDTTTNITDLVVA